MSSSSSSSSFGPPPLTDLQRGQLDVYFEMEVKTVDVLHWTGLSAAQIQNYLMDRRLEDAFRNGRLAAYHELGLPEADIKRHMDKNKNNKSKFASALTDYEKGALHAYDALELSYAEMAKRTGRSASAISNYLRLGQTAGKRGRKKKGRYCGYADSSEEEQHEEDIEIGARQPKTPRKMATSKPKRASSKTVATPTPAKKMATPTPAKKKVMATPTPKTKKVMATPTPKTKEVMATPTPKTNKVMATLTPKSPTAAVAVSSRTRSKTTTTPQYFQRIRIVPMDSDEENEEMEQNENEKRRAKSMLPLMRGNNNRKKMIIIASPSPDPFEQGEQEEAMPKNDDNEEQQFVEPRREDEVVEESDIDSELDLRLVENDYDEENEGME